MALASRREGGGEIWVQRRVWEAAALREVRYFLQRGKMRLDLEPHTDARSDAQRAAARAAGGGARVPAPPLPWEITSAEELYELSVEDKARSALGAGLRLPRARCASVAATHGHHSR